MANWLSRVSRKRLLLWALGPWLPMFLLGNVIVSESCGFPGVPTVEGLEIHALFTAVGIGGMLAALTRVGSAPLALIMSLVPWAVIVITGLEMVRMALQIVCGIIYMIGLASA
jgi:hypothetical protein